MRKLRRKERTPLQRFRGEVRANLRLQLETMLNGPSTMPDGSQGTVLDDIVARSLVGYGFTISLSVAHPDAPGQAVEDPSVTARLAEEAVTGPRLILPADG